MKFYNDEVTDILLHKHSYSREDYPSLSFKNYKIIYQIWNTNDDSKIVTTHPLLKENLSVKNFKTLSRSNWLNDEVINAYIKLILKREKDKGNDEKKFYIFNTFFYIFLEKLKKGTETLDKVMKVTRRAQVQISECSRFIIPMNPSNNHWDFMEIDNVKRTITFNDSLLLRKNAGEQPFKVISNFLEKAIPNEQNQSQGGANGLSHSNGYTYQPYKFVVNEDYPKQDNLNDCGVFMLKGIEFRSRNAKIDFDANDMLYFRNLIAYELYNGNLLNC